jgi:hypothetical protein
MNNKTSKDKSRGGASAKKTKTISYRLKCARTANGLSHYVMYGDVDKKQALL